MIPMTDELLKLAERCEKATGPDREIDGDIQIEIDPLCHSVTAADIFSESGHYVGRLLAYTASLDAAMTLVPEGFEFAVGSGRRAAMSETMKRPWGNVFAPDDIGSPADNAATPALALCAAALRARAASKDQP